MNENPLHIVIRGALRSAQNDHPEINYADFMTSISKRVAGAVTGVFASETCSKCGEVNSELRYVLDWHDVKHDCTAQQWSGKDG